jgi:Uri superfamily endonuclease
MKQDTENPWAKGGSYLLLIELTRDASIRIGAMGRCGLKKGMYAYVGSARSGIGARVERHARLARQGHGSVRWHIDFVLSNRHAALIGAVPFPGIDECTLSRIIASEEGVSAPVRGLGASDCTNRCPSHFYTFPAAHHRDIASLAAVIKARLASNGASPRARAL